MKGKYIHLILVVRLPEPSGLDGGGGERLSIVLSLIRSPRVLHIRKCPK